MAGVVITLQTDVIAASTNGVTSETLTNYRGGNHHLGRRAWRNLGYGLRHNLGYSGSIAAEKVQQYQYTARELVSSRPHQ